jgi:hypothetical protein
MDGVSHTVEVTATTLYEAVAQGLAAIRGNEWVAGIAQGLNVVKVSVANVRVEHEVKLMDFTTIPGILFERRPPGVAKRIPSFSPQSIHRPSEICACPPDWRMAS